MSSPAVKGRNGVLVRQPLTLVHQADELMATSCWHSWWPRRLHSAVHWLLAGTHATITRT